uniref:Uncharacterized protein n=1 Tax=Arundo donax TaxID=35708 RepID=A0A0A9EJN3_ARUDO
MRTGRSRTAHLPRGETFMKRQR